MALLIPPLTTPELLMTALAPELISTALKLELLICPPTSTEIVAGDDVIETSVHVWPLSTTTVGSEQFCDWAG